MDETLAALQAAYNNAQEAYNSQQTALNNLRNNPGYLSLLTAFSNPKIASNPNGWIDSSGNFYTSGDAPINHAAGAQQFLNFNNQIVAAAATLQQLNTSLQQAQTNLSNYTTNNPTTLAQISASAGVSTTQTLVIGGVIIAILIIGAIAYFRSRKS